MLPTNLNLVECLEYRAAHQPDQLAYQYLRRGETVEAQLTYRELRDRARNIALRLQSLSDQSLNNQSRGIAGQRALLLFSPGLDFVTAFLGCLQAGVTAVPAYPPRKNQKLLRLQNIVRDAAATVVLTTADLAEKIAPKSVPKDAQWFDANSPLANVHWLSIDSLEATAPEETHLSTREPALASNPLAFLQYTSGSTGLPKGVMVSQQNIMHNLAAIYRCFGHGPESKGVIWLPPYHDMGLIGGILQPLYGGFPVTLMSPVDFLQKPLRWLQAISTYRGSTSGGPDFAYDVCVRKAEALLVRDAEPPQLSTLDLSCWKVAFTGAEPVRADTLARFTKTFEPYGFNREAFYPCYGMAETTLIVSGGPVSAPPVVATVSAEQLAQNKVVSVEKNDLSAQTLIGCGTSLSDQQVVIVNPETLTGTKAGEVGEVWVAGESVAQGYWHNEEATRQCFRAYRADTGEGPFLRTGDLGFIQTCDDHEELFITGRIKDVMIIRGRNYYPQDIERTIEESSPALRSGSVAAFSVEIKGAERLVVIAEVKRTLVRKLDVQAVVGRLRQAVTANHDLQLYAALLVRPGQVPKTSSGKIQRYRCRELFLTGEFAVVKDWSENPRHKSEFVNIQSEVDSLFKTLTDKS